MISLTYPGRHKHCNGLVSNVNHKFLINDDERLKKRTEAVMISQVKGHRRLSGSLPKLVLVIPEVSVKLVFPIVHKS